MTRKNFYNEHQIYNLHDLENHYRRLTGGHWFDPSSMRFFNTRLSNELLHDGGKFYFVSSEQQSGWGGDYPRMYSIRTYDPVTGQIETVGEFQEYATRAAAIRAMRKMATCPKPA